MIYLCVEGCSVYLFIKFYLIFLFLLRLYVKEFIDYEYWCMKVILFLFFFLFFACGNIYKD